MKKLIAILAVILAVMMTIIVVRSVDFIKKEAADATFDESTQDEAPTAAPTMPPTQPPTDPPTIDELAHARYDQILSSKLTNNFGVIDDVEPFGQLNGMQAGCEALALTAAINHFGYDLDIDDIVDDYLVYGNDYVTSFCGNPRKFYDGSGIYPPGVVTTVWNFVEENDAQLYPFDTTGLSLEELYKFVGAGCPVLIWTTYNRYSPSIEQYREYEGVKYPWFDTEHCVCLHGYDLDDNEVKIADSWNYGSDDWENADRFERIYDEVGQFSLVLMDTSKLR